ncbi:hypothetical protein HYH03_009694 [Edaphochlamys debaryana]|uniref:protein-L-isoaspartate(D-aspartate) O-methyltransferase n=1 Tax=Edaphochlamys debaryana TaxID=47281 RepID=A0A835XZN6_9CHLO|nr:hypothetical protein HYH03_009694 [Edaphochlamys debaryana]|eukprot:KAG2491963.1 hypothetical protein HYH03_009694 [Edaphochlamys debaryana]
MSDDEHAPDQSDSEEEDEGAEHELPAAEPGARRDRLERIALFDFLRLVAAGNDGHRNAGFADNAALVNHLKSNGTVTSDAVARAMLACPRDLFVPPPHRPEALVDRPIRVEASGFNISAPHVQAAALEALKLEAGMRVLDVGCGCGIVAAYAAYMVGSKGQVTGIDIREAALTLAEANLARLRGENLEFAEEAAPITLDRHNVFIPLQRHKGKYNAVHVGGATPESRVSVLLDLLGPGGGRIVAPVGNEFRLITKLANGSVKTSVLSTVSFTELEVPRDVALVAAVEEERAERARRVEVPPSTFAFDLKHLAPPGADLAGLAAAAAEATAAADAAAAASATAAATTASATAGTSTAEPGVTEPTSASTPRPPSPGRRPRSQTCVTEDHAAAATLAPAHRGRTGVGEDMDYVLLEKEAAAPAGPEDAGAGPATVPRPERPADAQTQPGELRLPAYLLPPATSAPAPAADTDADAGAGPGPSSSSAPPGAVGVVGVLGLGSPDCELAGPGWRLPAHKAVLQARCELLRAHMGSGMRDSDAAVYGAPPALERADAMEAFLHYVYQDCLPPGGVDSEVMPQLLHAGIYYGCHRLVRLCESLLARELVAAGQPGADAEVLAAAVAAAGPLLALADEGGLDALRGVAMQFVLDHFSAVSASEGYQQLPRALVDAVAGEAVRRYTGLLGHLGELARVAGPGESWRW